MNLGLFQRDVNVIWDLAVHDFAIMDYLLKARPVAISASGAGFVPNSPENMAHLSVFYDDGSMAHLNVNWLAPVKIRQALIGGSRRMVIYDDMQTSEKVKVYDRGVSLDDAQKQAYEHLVSYRIGQMFAPALSSKEALLTEVEEFAHCIETERPSGDGRRLRPSRGRTAGRRNPVYGDARPAGRARTGAAGFMIPFSILRRSIGPLVRTSKKPCSRRCAAATTCSGIASSNSRRTSPHFAAPGTRLR